MTELLGLLNFFTNLAPNEYRSTHIFPSSPFPYELVGLLRTPYKNVSGLPLF